MTRESRLAPGAGPESKNIALVYEPLPEPLLVPVDRAQMIQVFTNLVGNAVSYTPPGGRAVVTAVREQLDNTPGVSVRFVNNGPLIPPEDVPNLFRRFYRGRTPHDSG